MQLSSVQDLMVMTLQDLYSAEKQLLEATPAVMRATSSPDLQEVLMQHTKETERQVTRLEETLARLGEEPRGRHSKPAEALLMEIKEIAQMDGDADVKDAALLACQQKFEHNEIACYGTAVTFAKLMGDQQSARMLAQTLDEEEQMDRRLNDLAKRKINKEAEAAAPMA